MKRTPAIALALLVVATIGVATPSLGAATVCEEGGGADCCGFDCALCVCCSHLPRVVVGERDRLSGGGPVGTLRPETAATPRPPLPRDILHVPKAAPLPAPTR